MTRLVDVIGPELREAGACLEIGIGTGRFALPLARAGVRIAGVDISREMLRRLAEKSSDVSISVAIADATRLPFADATFGAGLAAHVLHLIPEWRTAVAELVRVVRRGGKIISDTRGRPESEWYHAIRSHFYEVAGATHWPPGVGSIEELDEEMARHGASIRSIPVSEEERSYTINEALGLLEQGIYSACWSLDEPTRRRAAEDTRRWAVQNVGDLDDRRRVVETMTWRIYDL